MLFQFYGGRFGGAFFQNLESFGFIDAIFPFALVFTVVYGILRKIKIFGKDASNRFDIIIALVTGVAFVYPHVSGRYQTWGVTDPVNIINQSIPQVGVFIIAILMFMILLGMLGFSKFGALQQLTALLAFIVVIAIFANAAGWLTSSWISYYFGDPDVQAFLVIILVLGGLLFFLGEEKPGGGGGLEGWTKNLEKLVGKPD